ncbi:MAG: hypothetical protein OEM52_12770 [bacterium]|nr:hypothetical protein [bacterium]
MQYRTTLLFVLLLLFLSSGCAYYNSLYNAKKNFDKGLAAKQLPNASPGSGNADFEKVIDGCALMVELYPKSKLVPEALLLMGKSYFESNQFPKAERKFIELENNFPQYKNLTEAKLYKARTWLALKRTTEGRALLGELTASPIETISYSARLLLADGLINDSLYSAALETITPLVATAPTPEIRAEANAKRAFCLDKLNRLSEAIEVLEEVLQAKWSRSKQYDLRMRRAELLIRDNRPKVAFADLRKLYRDSDFRSKKNRTTVLAGRAALALGDTITAKKYWMELLRDDRLRTEETADASYQMGLLLYSEAEIDSIVYSYLDRSKRDSPVAISAIAADSLSKRIRWLRDTDARLKTAYERWLVLLDIKEGRPVPDSLRTKFLRNASVVSRIDPLAPKMQIDESDTTVIADSTYKTKDTVIASVPHYIPEEPIPNKTQSVAILDSLPLVSDSLALILDSLNSDTIQLLKKIESTAIANDSTLLFLDSLFSDSMQVLRDDDSTIIAFDTTESKPDSLVAKKDTVAVRFDSTAFYVEWESVSNQLVAIYVDQKDDVLRLKDTITALSKFPTILQTTLPKNRNSYLIEYALLLKQSGGDTLADSIFHTLTEERSNLAIANLARSELSLPLLPIPKDSLQEQLFTAERIVDEEHDTLRAIQLYKSLAAADTGTVGNKAVAALAILQIGRVPIDSMRALFTTMQKRVTTGSGATFARNILSVLNDTLPKFDSLAMLDSLKKLDSLAMPDSLAIPDSLQLRDTLSTRSDSLSSNPLRKRKADSSIVSTNKRDTLSVPVDTLFKRDTIQQRDSLPPKIPIVPNGNSPTPSGANDPPKKEE